ncbi:glycosyl hydrolase family 8 [Paenibacillus thiaminolyticus]|uniref:glycosyl hydrolase family 8 n=1 Tax=Paenibacillus thiaminolyticus TaxID=49283 RepID=UPI003D275087
MAWQQIDNGSAIVNNTEAGSDAATDGDMDMAYALLLADKQWGSSSGINYRAEAVNLINAIMQSEVNKQAWHLKHGDWVSDSDSKWAKERGRPTLCSIISSPSRQRPGIRVGTMC